MSRNRVQDAKMEGELLALTYGAIVARVMKDTEQCEEANAQVECPEVLFNEFRQFHFCQFESHKNRIIFFLTNDIKVGQNGIQHWCSID